MAADDERRPEPQPSFDLGDDAAQIIAAIERSIGLMRRTTSFEDRRLVVELQDILDEIRLALRRANS